MLLFYRVKPRPRERYGAAGRLWYQTLASHWRDQALAARSEIGTLPGLTGLQGFDSRTVPSERHQKAVHC